MTAVSLLTEEILHARDPEIDQLDNVPAIPEMLKHDVLRLQIAMNNALVMRGLQRATQLPQNGSHLVNGSGPSSISARSVRPSTYCITRK